MMHSCKFMVAYKYHVYIYIKRGKSIIYNYRREHRNEEDPLADLASSFGFRTAWSRDLGDGDPVRSGA